MKFAVLSSVLFATSVSAQYFSKGWEPGQNRKPVDSLSFTPYTFQPQPTGAVPGNTAAPEKQINNAWSILDFAPVKALLGSVGINVGNGSIFLNEIWDNRVPLITDDNFEELIVNENLTSGEEKSRVWFLVITVSSTQREGISRYVDSQFDEAFNMTQVVGDLPNVRWGRIDYMNVTSITTKWGVWSAPYLVVLKDRGKSLRFYKAHQLRITPETLREFLRVEGWQRTPVWSSSFAPGGSSAYILEWSAILFSKIYQMTSYIPKWLLILLTGSLASILVNFLHGSRSSAQVTTTTTTPPTVDNSGDTQESSSKSSSSISKENSSKKPKNPSRK